MTDPALELHGADVALERERELRKRIFTPPPQLTVSQWADRFRVLTSIASAEPGRWRTDRAPYQRGIMDAFSDPMTERVVVMMSAQSGKTEIILNIGGYFIDQDPAPILVLQPTIDMARAFSKDRLREMIRATPVLRTKIRESGRRQAEDTILHKQFAGGHITMVGANSAASLASRPIRIVLNDEVDRFPASAGDEGDPVSLAKKRTATFWNRKEGLFSTPTVKGASRIEEAHDEGDQRKYFVPCPHCGHRQHLRWEQMDLESACYVCEGCAALIAETDKPAMLSKGEWVATNPGPRTASFHLNAIYSPWVTWTELVGEYLEAQHNPERMRVFVNTVLAQTFEHQGAGVDPASLSARRELYEAEVPAGVGVLTAAIDVQDDRLELAVKGWGAGQESWLIAHHRVIGDTRNEDVWLRADALLTKAYQHAAGAQLHVMAACVDSGNRTQLVYNFVRPRQTRNVFATKGVSIRGKPLIGKIGRPNKHAVRVVPVGTDTAKDVIFPRLKIQRPELHPADAPIPGFMHFPMQQADGADEEYLAQFGAEKVFFRDVKGTPVPEYRQVRRRNEAIDLEVLNLVALYVLGAGVYDQLARWVAKAQADGARAREQAAKMPEPPPPTGVQPLLPASPRPRIPRPGGYVNKWRS